MEMQYIVPRVPSADDHHIRMGGTQQAGGVMHLHIFHPQHGGHDGNRHGIAEIRADAIPDKLFIPGGGAMDDDFLDGAK